jgi:hypothetical protein
MTPALRMPIAAVRWAVSLATSMVAFLALWIFVALVGALIFGGSWDVVTESSPISVNLHIFACASYGSILVGAVVAPHRHWQLATGILSFNLMLTVVALCIDDIRTTGEAGFRNRDFGDILGIAIGALLAYWTLHRRWHGRIETPRLSNRTRIAVIAVCAVAFLLPLRSVTVPPWRVQFVDEQGEALSGLRINQHWVDFFAWQAIGMDDVRTTDAAGVVAFPERVVRASIALRLWGPIRDAMDSLMSPASGHYYAHLSPRCPMHTLERDAAYYDGTSFATQLHLAEGEKRNPHPEYDCSCERLLDQLRRARIPR